MKFTCEFCNIKFTNKSYLRRHLRHHMEPPQQQGQQKQKFTCYLCSETFEKKVNYKNHIIGHSNFNLYKCLWCNFSTSNITLLHDHRYLHKTENGLFMCCECSNSFSCITDHDIHMLLFHMQSYLKLISTEQIFPCSLCGRVFHRFPDLSTHLTGNHMKECSRDFRDKMLDCESGAVLERKYLCSACGNFVRTLGALKTHRCKNMEEKSLTCLTCERKFQTRSQLNSHMYMHTGQKPFLCSHCPYRSRRMQYMKRHMLRHSGEKTHLCTICGQAFLFPEALKRHTYKHAVECPYSCTLCTFRTSDPNGLTQHMTKHINSVMLCDKCSFSCVRTSDMKKHKLSHVVDERIPCTSCGLTFSDMKDLQSHMLQHVDQRLPSYSCDFCDFTSQIQKEYVTHMQIHSVHKPFACTQCDYHSNRRMNLKVHMMKKHKLSLTNVITIKCKFCHFSCERSQDYIKHMATNHDIDKPFDCPVCPFATHRQSLLKIHIETHKPHGFSCDLCSFKCKRRTLLNKHKETKHSNNRYSDDTVSITEQKVYACKHCPFITKHYASLRNHIPAHSGLKLACEECSYVTYAKRNLLSHMKSHTRDQPFRCMFCSYSSARKNNFKLHMVRHIHEKLWFCDQCDFNSREKNLLTKHIEESHGEVAAADTKTGNAVMLHVNGDESEAVEIYPSAEYNQNNNRMQIENDQTEPVAKTSVIETGMKESIHKTSVREVGVKESVHKTFVTETGIKESIHKTFVREVGIKESVHKTFVTETGIRESIHKTFVNESVNENISRNMGSDSVDHKDKLRERCPPLAALEYSYVNIRRPGHIQHDAHFSSYIPGSSLLLTSVKDTVFELQQKNDVNMTSYAPDDYTEKSLETHSTPVEYFIDSTPGSEAQQCHSVPEKCRSSTPLRMLTDGKSRDNTYPPRNKRVIPPHYELLHSYQKTSCDYIEESQRILTQQQCSGVPVTPEVKTHQQCPIQVGPDTPQDGTCSWRVTALPCSFQCSDKDDLKQHAVLHSPAFANVTATFTCSVCHLSFSRSVDLDRHNSNSHQQPVTHKNQNDPETSDILKTHTSVEESVYAEPQISVRCYRCLECSFETDRPSSFKCHMISLHNIEKAFSCSLCSYRAKREDDLKTHSMTHNERMIRSCSICNYTCKRAPALRKHMRKHTDVRLFSCHLCDFWCNYEPDLRSHVLKVHEKPKIFACQACSYSTSFAVHFTKHMATAHGVVHAFRCPDCEYTSPVWNNFRAHKLKHNRTRIYTCDICEAAFSWAASLKNHMHVHINVKPLKCSQCEYKCSLPEKLKIHIRKHTNDRPFICRNCQRSFTHSSSLYKHISVVHNKTKRHTCLKCLYAASTSTQLKRHMLTHDVGNTLHCKECHFGCNHLEVLRNHMLIHNPAISINPSSKKADAPESRGDESGLLSSNVSENSANPQEMTSRSESGGLTCSACKLAFSSMADLKIHVSKCHRPSHVRKFFCSVCEFSCLRPYELKIHTTFHTGEKPFSCGMCDFACHKPYMLKYHRQKWHSSQGSKDTGLMACQMCAFTSSSRLHLKQHVQEKHESSTSQPENSSTENENLQPVISSITDASWAKNEPKGCRPYKCSDCGFSASRKGSLNIHMLRHVQKRFLCHLCDYMCHREAELRRHLQTHEGRKPLSCDQCSYTCIQPSTLRVHLLKHKGEKPVHCRLCDFRCRQKSTLRDHMSTHSDERKFACDWCDYRAKRFTSLKMHLLTHSSERPVSCKMCDFTCKHMNALRSHMRSHALDVKLSEFQIV